jgi:hypothetical protein
MNKVIILVCTLLLSIGIINAQKLDYKYWDKTGEYAYAHKIITPTLQNLITLVDLPQSNFISLMNEYGYFQDSDMVEPSDYTFAAFCNYSLDFFMEPLNGFGTNSIEQSEIKKCVRFIGKLNNLSPRDALNNLAKDLQKYYTKQIDGKDCFVIQIQQGGGYVILIGSSNGYYTIECIHLDK